jgi:predicted amidohydrolase
MLGRNGEAAMGTAWKIAGVQMDCRLGDKPHNLAAVRQRMRTAAGRGARLVVFPECVLTGYGFDSLDEALPLAEPLPGPSTEALAADCRELGVWVVVGLLERGGRPGEVYNACALIGPGGLAATYRKAHLPFLGVDRFTTPGDRPFAVHDLGGLRVGMLICYDASFPEAARALTLLGADLIVLPTNWPPGAIGTARLLIPARALENHVYFAAVDRVGEERGFRFIGRSQVVNCGGAYLAGPAGEGEELLEAEVDPDEARTKHRVIVPGRHEVHRTADRRPELYGPLCDPRLVPPSPSNRPGADVSAPRGR